MTSAVDSTDPIVLESPAPSDNRAGTRYYEPLTFEGAAGEVIHANLSASGTSAVLTLRNSDGETVAVSENMARDEPVHLVSRLPSDGEYTLRVLGTNPMTTFRYTLSLSRVDHTESNPESIDVGEVVIGEISDTDNELDRFYGHHDNITLSVRRGQRIDVRLDSSANSIVWLYSPNGTLLERNFWPRGEPAGFSTELPYGGDYRLVVSDRSRSPPFPYRFSVSPSGAEPIPDLEERREEREYAEFEVLSSTLNTTTRYAGTPFELTVEVRNTGTVWGDFEGYVLAGRTQLAWVEDAIGYGRSAEITVRSSIDQPGNYPVFVGAEYVGQVRVLPRPSPTLSVSTRGETTRAVMNYTRANSTFEIPLTSHSGTGSEFTDLRVRFGRPTRQLTLQTSEQRVTTGAVSVDGVRSPLPEGIRPIRLLTLTRRFPGMTNGVADTSVEFEVATETLTRGVSDVVVYQARADGTGWTATDPTLVSASESGARFRSTITDSSTVVIAERVPIFEVSNVTTSTETIEAGSSISVTAEVHNRGLATGTEEMSLVLDEQQVTTRWVTLAPNGSTTVRFQRSVEDTGQHRVSIANRSTNFEVLRVSERTTPTPTSSPTITPVTTATPAAEPPTTAPASATPDAVDDVFAPIGRVPVPLLFLLLLSLLGGFALVVSGLSEQERDERQFGPDSKDGE